MIFEPETIFIVSIYILPPASYVILLTTLVPFGMGLDLSPKKQPWKILKHKLKIYIYMYVFHLNWFM